MTLATWKHYIIFILLAILLLLSWVHLIEHLNSVQPKLLPNFTLITTTDNTTIQYDNQTLHIILLWSDATMYPFDLFGTGSKVFQKYKCAFQNCYVTAKRNYFGGDLTKFDVIAFNGRHLSANDIPNRRLRNQNYIYFNTESADNYPVCSDVFDNFFNMTATYRLDSDLPFQYLDVQDMKGNVIGPKVDMIWETSSKKSNVSKVFKKTKAVAWFVSNCQSRSSRRQFAKQIQRALSPFGYTLDIYGRCGDKKCSRDNGRLCNAMLAQDYYFYFSAENSFCEDYVTEKVLTAMQNDAVPIVYGGADYYRFLPPHSFIDSRAYTPDELASLIIKLIGSPEDYQSYFEWKNYYRYSSANRERQICALCEALNKKPTPQIVYERFRKWWYPNFESRC